MNETANRLPPKNWLAMTGSGVMNPPTRFGAASIMIMTMMRIFCSPMYMTCPRVSLVSIWRISAPFKS